jgi:hypothetical protein
MRQSAAPGYLLKGPAPLAQPLLDQPLERIKCLFWCCVIGGARPLRGGVLPVLRHVRRHNHQPSYFPELSSGGRGRDALARPLDHAVR